MYDFGRSPAGPEPADSADQATTSGGGFHQFQLFGVVHAEELELLGSCVAKFNLLVIGN